ncbi:hypothetical protein DRP05_06620 [Archaeoglobales archaeon]|nr:MAG: hypothetical protein DRP05_06620 [Archaeoglobales archaeon]
MIDDFESLSKEEIIERCKEIIKEKDAEIERLKRKLWVRELEDVFGDILEKEELEKIKNMDPLKAAIEIGKIIKNKRIKEKKVELPSDDLINEVIEDIKRFEEILK